MIYLDNAATSFPKPAAVFQQVLGTLMTPLGNPGRSGHALSQEAAELVFSARESIARLVGPVPSERIVFCSGATAALNLAIRGTAQALCRKGKIPFVITSVFEHNSVLRPLFLLAREGKIRLRILSPKKDGNLSCDDFFRATPDMVVLTCRSNLNGHEFDLKHVFSLLRQRNCIVILDGAQALGSKALSLGEMEADILCAPGHKGLMGLMGGGFLAISASCPLLPEAVLCGGSGNDSFNPEMPNTLPERLEAGTLPLLAIASMKAGAEFLLKTGVDEIQKWEERSKHILIQGIRSLPRYRIYEPEYPEGPLLINHSAIPPEELGGMLARKGILTRAGYHCAPLAHRYLGTEKNGALRLSPGPFTTGKELSATLEALEAIR